MAEKALGVGVIGFGFMGRTHTFAHRALPFFYDPPPVRTRMVAGCRTNQALAEAAKVTGGFERIYAKQEDLIRDPEIDLVHICTPNREHVAALRLAMQLNKHIYVDKPATGSLADAEEIEKLLAAYTGLAQVALQYRCFPATLKAKQLVDEGFLGPVTHFRAAYLHSGNIDPNRPANWKFTQAGGGGVIRDLGSHILDLLDHLIGPFSRVLCASRIWVAQRPDPAEPGQRVDVDAEDAAIMLLERADGAIGTVEASKIASGTEDELRFEIHGRDGAMRFNLMEPNFLEICDARLPDGALGGSRGWQRISCIQKYPPPGNQFPSGKNTVGWLRAHIHSIYLFLDCIAHGRPPRPSLRDGLRLQRMLEAAIVSARNRSWVELK